MRKLETMLDYTIEVTNPGEPSVVTLIEELDAYLTALYPAESNHLASIEMLCQPHVRFLTARTEEGERIACASCFLYDSYAELKRMYVRPAFRGNGIAFALLSHLEEFAGSRGIPYLRLETGIYQAEALRFYEKCGYEYRGSFGSYPDDVLSRFMEKSLQNAQPRTNEG
ncbi:MAG: GNAT family N-acetyltransferase [bacterium]